jgi:hypothetical protein
MRIPVVMEKKISLSIKKYPTSYVAQINLKLSDKMIKAASRETRL